MSVLAINGGSPVFGEKNIADYMPQWPIPHPETEEKLIKLYRSGQWGMCSEYEQKLIAAYAEYQGTKHSIWMTNGTVTLECALLALGIGPGDEVIVPGISWLATAEAPIYVGATPVIVDVDPDTICIDPKKIEE
ncbi:MAG: aminotransferase class I/II-fold pyridoxal phosphate-dependent enzyme, partial [Lentisphaeria bacterium]|nr:aminotransferase class I/II-fold pyridoxal phosphate-dependent enzyme [Lentisphaeria bacterium]